MRSRGSSIQSVMVSVGGGGGGERTRGGRGAGGRTGRREGGQGPSGPPPGGGSLGGGGGKLWRRSLRVVPGIPDGLGTPGRGPSGLLPTNEDPPQGFPTPVQPAHDRARRDVEDPADLGIAQAVHVAQAHRHPEDLGHFLERLPDVLGRQAVDLGLLGGLRGHRQGVELLVGPSHRAELGPPVAVDLDAPQDREQPRFHVRPGLELGEGALGLQVRLLDEVLRVGGPPHEAHREREAVAEHGQRRPFEGRRGRCVCHPPIVPQAPPRAANAGARRIPVPMRTLVSVNGRASAPEDAVVPALDRGFLYGDSVYEVLWWHRGAPVQADDHMARLRESARRIYMEVPGPDGRYLDEIRRTLAAAGCGPSDEVYVRLVVTRGVTPLGLRFEGTTAPTVVVIVAEAHRPTPRSGRRASRSRSSTGCASRARALDPAAKTGNYMNNLLALHEANQRGSDDAVLLNDRGEVTEAHDVERLRRARRRRRDAAARRRDPQGHDAHARPRAVRGERPRARGGAGAAPRRPAPRRRDLRARPPSAA